jgi:hypothetical protein
VLNFHTAKKNVAECLSFINPSFSLQRHLTSEQRHGRLKPNECNGTSHEHHLLSLKEEKAAKTKSCTHLKQTFGFIDLLQLSCSYSFFCIANEE